MKAAFQMLAWSLALGAAAPALAQVTFDSATLAAGARVTVGDDVDELTSSSSVTQAFGGQLDASALVADPSRDVMVSANAAVAASWSSASAGSVSIFWSWDAQNAGSDLLTKVETNLVPPNWSYTFTTGALAATFKMAWTLDVSSSVSSTFGLQGMFGGGSMPFYVTPSGAEPTSDSGMFSIALDANTIYTLELFNYGNLSSSVGGLSSTAAAGFAADWAITPVPEPGTWALMLGGLGLLAARARRREVAAT
jgi:hypothetical protein